MIANINYIEILYMKMCKLYNKWCKMKKLTKIEILLFIIYI
jgi:hypothetical protein